MPELPEVEARRIAMNRNFKEKRLQRINIVKKGIIKHNGSEKDFLEKSLDQIDRRGKYLIFKFSGNKTFVLHFGLFGEMAIADSTYGLSSICAEFGFNTGKNLYIFKWASIWFNKQIEELAVLGYDPVAEKDRFTLTYLEDALLKKKTKMKRFLMDQSIIAGIGSVYADEILFKAGVLPMRDTGSLKKDEAERLYQMIVKVLEDAIKKTVAYGREDRRFLSLENRVDCPVCSTGIVKTRFAGRRTVYCPVCQH